MYLRKAGGVFDLRIACIGSAVADVVTHGAGKHIHVLLNDADAAVQRLLLYVPNVDAVYLYTAGVEIVKPEYELAEGGLAAAGGSDERKTSSRLDL